MGAGPLLALGGLFGCSASDDVESVDPTAVVSAGSVMSSPVTSSTGTAEPTTAPSTPPPSTPPPSTMVVPTTATPESAVTAAPDPVAVLASGLDGLAGGYHFVTTVTVGDQQALVAEGDRVGTGTRMRVDSNGRSVDYVVTPDGTWVAESGTWQELDQVAQASDPLGALRAPSAVATTGTPDAGRTNLVATYPAAAFGLAGDATVDVSVTIIDGSVATLVYTDAASSATVQTDISALTDTTPVTVPNI